MEKEHRMTQQMRKKVRYGGNIPSLHQLSSAELGLAVSWDDLVWIQSEWSNQTSRQQDFLEIMSISRAESALVSENRPDRRSNSDDQKSSRKCQIRQHTGGEPNRNWYSPSMASMDEATHSRSDDYSSRKKTTSSHEAFIKVVAFKELWQTHF